MIYLLNMVIVVNSHVPITIAPVAPEMALSDIGVSQNGNLNED